MDDRIAYQVTKTRRCHNCGAPSLEGRCGECGSKVGPRQKIGVVAGVAQNFGVVNNVYNFGGETEVVDLRDVQDGLNARFPERIPLPTQTPWGLLPPGTKSKLVRILNPISYVMFVGFILSMVAAAFLVLR